MILLICSRSKPLPIVFFVTGSVLLHHRVLWVQVLPLQVASLALVSLPWTLPRLLDLQAANPAAVLHGKYSGLCCVCDGHAMHQTYPLQCLLI